MKVTFLFVTQAPSESIIFSLEAFDADRDELSYVFMISDTCSASMDSMLGISNTVEFEARHGGFFCVQGRVHDGEDYVSRNWYITVIEESNEPPRIVSITPDLDSLSCVIGNTIEFRVGAFDENPQILRYTFSVNGVQIKRLATSPIFTHRFGENGRYDVIGTVTDWEFDISIEWHINVTGVPDTVPPDGIYDLEGWTGIQTGSVELRWTAPGDDGDEGRSLAYKVKTATLPILTEDDWEEASIKYDSPEPGIAGSVENMTVINCYPGTFLFVTARAVDDFGNLGPLGNCISLLVRGYDAIGVVTDAGSGQPVEGIVVSVDLIVDTTDAMGAYLLSNLPKYSELVRVRDEGLSGEGEYGRYYDIARAIEEPTAHFTLDLQMIPVFGLVSCREEWYSDFLDFFEEMTGTAELNSSSQYKGWNHWPLKVYNPPMVLNEVDLQNTARGSMAAWEDGTGFDLFVEVADPALADWAIVYRDGNENHTVPKSVYEYNSDGTVRWKEMWIYLGNTSLPVWKKGHLIYNHELGHILGVMHSYDTGHLMIGGTTPYVTEPSVDELRLISVIRNFPPIWDSDWIMRN